MYEPGNYFSRSVEEHNSTASPSETNPYPGEELSIDSPVPLSAVLGLLSPRTPRLNDAPLEIDFLIDPIDLGFQENPHYDDSPMLDFSVSVSENRPLRTYSTSSEEECVYNPEQELHILDQAEKPAQRVFHLLQQPGYLYLLNIIKPLAYPLPDLMVDPLAPVHMRSPNHNSLLSAIEDYETFVDLPKNSDYEKVLRRCTNDVDSTGNKYDRNTYRYSSRWAAFSFSTRYFNSPIKEFLALADSASDYTRALRTYNDSRDYLITFPQEKHTTSGKIRRSKHRGPIPKSFYVGPRTDYSRCDPDSKGVLRYNTIHTRSANDPVKKEFLMSHWSSAKASIQNPNLRYIQICMNDSYRTLLNGDWSGMHADTLRSLKATAALHVADLRNNEVKLSQNLLARDDNYIYLKGVPLLYGILVDYIVKRSFDIEVAKYELTLLYKYFVKGNRGSAYDLEQYLHAMQPFWFANKILLNLKCPAKPICYDRRFDIQSTQHPDNSNDPEVGYIVIPQSILPRYPPLRKKLPFQSVRTEMISSAKSKPLIHPIMDQALFQYLMDTLFDEGKPRLSDYDIDFLHFINDRFFYPICESTLSNSEKNELCGLCMAAVLEVYTLRLKASTYLDNGKYDSKLFKAKNTYERDLQEVVLSLGYGDFPYFDEIYSFPRPKFKKNVSAPSSSSYNLNPVEEEKEAEVPALDPTQAHGDLPDISRIAEITTLINNLQDSMKDIEYMMNIPKFLYKMLKIYMAQSNFHKFDAWADMVLFLTNWAQPISDCLVSVIHEFSTYFKQGSVHTEAYSDFFTSEISVKFVEIVKSLSLASSLKFLGFPTLNYLIDELPRKFLKFDPKGGFTIDTFFDKVLAFFSLLLNKTLQCITTRSLDPFLENTRSFNVTRAEVEFICKNDDAIGDQFTQRKVNFNNLKTRGGVPPGIEDIMGFDEALRKLDELEGELNVHRRFSTEQSLPTIQQLLNDIRDRRLSVNNSKAANTSRVPAYGLFIYGKPGVGKSTLMTHLTRAVLRSLGYIGEMHQKHQYRVDTSMNFQDGIHPDVVNLVLDDVDQLRDDTSIQPAVTIINKACDTQNYIIDQASLDKKGMAIAPKLLTICANNSTAGIDRVTTSTAYESFERRRNLTVLLKVKPEFEGHNGIVDLAKLGNIPFEKAVFYLVKEFRRDVKMQDLPFRQLEFDQFMKYFIKSFREFTQREQAMLDQRTFPLCSKCFTTIYPNKECEHDDCDDEVPSLDQFPEVNNDAVPTLTQKREATRNAFEERYGEGMSDRRERDRRFFSRYPKRGGIVTEMMVLEERQSFPWYPLGLIIVYFSVVGLFHQQLDLRIICATQFLLCLFWLLTFESVSTFSTYIRSNANLFRRLTNGQNPLPAVVEIYKPQWKKLALYVAPLTAASALLGIIIYFFTKKNRELILAEMQAKALEGVRYQVDGTVRAKEFRESPMTKFTWEEFGRKAMEVMDIRPRDITTSIMTNTVRLQRGNNVLYGLIISENFLLVPKHFFFDNREPGIVLDDPFGNFKVIMYRSGSRVEYVFDTFYGLKDKDLVICYLPAAMCILDTNNNPPIHYFRSSNSSVTSSLAFGGDLLNCDSRQRIGEVKVEAVDESNLKYYTYSSDCDTNGLCGSSIIMGGYVDGIHEARAHGTERKIATIIRRETLVTALNDFRVRLNLPVMHGIYVEMNALTDRKGVLGPIPPISNLNLQRCIREKIGAENPIIPLFSFEGGFIPKMKSNFQISPIYGSRDMQAYLGTLGADMSKWVAPRIIKGEFTYPGLELPVWQTPESRNLLGHCSVSAPSADLEFALATLLDIEFAPHPKLQPLSDYEIFKGDEFLNHFNRKASGGVGYGPNSSSFTFGEDGSVTCKSAILGRVAEIEKLLEQGILPASLSVRQLKDEIRSVKNLDDQKLRFFSVCTLPVTALARKHLGPLMTIFKNNPRGFQCTMGYDLGNDWNREILEQLAYFDPELLNDPVIRAFFCLDGKFYDIIGDEGMMLKVSIFVYVSLKLHGFTEKQARMSQLVFILCFMVINLLKTDYYFSRFILPSGAVITWIYNCIKSFIAYCIAYKRLVIDISQTARGSYVPRMGYNRHGLFPTVLIDKNYREMIRAWFCGDDAIAYIAKAIRHLMTQPRTAEILAPDVIQVQPENKGSEFVDHVSFPETRFMKRRYYVLREGGKIYHLSPIEPESLAKTLSHIDISSQLSFEDNVRSRLDNFMREMFHYGREEYQKAFNTVFHSDIDSKFHPSPHSWDELANLFMKGQMQPW